MPPIPGSFRQPVANAVRVGPVSDSELIEVTVRLRPSDSIAAAKIYSGSGTTRRKPALTRVDRPTLAAMVGASPVDVAAVASFASAHGLTVVDTSLPRRSVTLSGSAPAMQAAFGVSLENYALANTSFRHRQGWIQVPSSLQNIVQGVFGLDTRPQVNPHYRWAGPRAAAVAQLNAGTALLPQHLEVVYAFPAGTDGSGETIGILEFGGGYLESDLSRYCSQVRRSEPTVTCVSVDGAQNSPTGNPKQRDGEVALDLELAAGLAPGAKIVLYFAPIGDRGLIDALSAAVHDTANQPTVLSLSWGQPECAWTPQAIQAIDETLQEAMAAGITVCVATGDDGSSDGVNDGQSHVDFPASSPSALACGGTTLLGVSRPPLETAWADGGGGYSDLFTAPTWQGSSDPSGSGKRGVPDVSANADPRTGYFVVVDGAATVLGGTSAVAPIWAALIARCQQATGKRLSDLIPRLYQNASAFNDVSQGSNGAFSAAVGWDPCTGLGTPIGEQLLAGAWGQAPMQAHFVERILPRVNLNKGSPSDASKVRTWVGVGALVLVFAIAAAFKLSNPPTLTFGILAVALVFLCSTLVTGKLNPLSLALGADGRLSTSKFQFLLWTLVLVFSYCWLFAERLRYGGVGLSTTIPDHVIYLTGISIVGLTGAKGITMLAMATGHFQQPAPASGGTSLAYLVSGDDANVPDLSKVQMLAWTCIACVVYLINVTHAANAIAGGLSATTALPDIDASLVALMGLGHGAYLAGKVARVAGPPTGGASSNF